MSFSSYTPSPQRLATWLPPLALPKVVLPTLTAIAWFALLSAVFHRGTRERVISFVAAWPFFTRRYDFLKSNFEKSGKNFFSFKILQVCCPMALLLLRIRITFDALSTPLRLSRVRKRGRSSTMTRISVSLMGTLCCREGYVTNCHDIFLS